MITPHFARFIAPARANPQIWRLLLGTALIIAIYFITVGLIFATIWLLTGTENTLALARETTQATTPTGMYLLFASFFGAALGPLIAVRIFHNRPAATLFGPRVRALRHFAAAAATVMALNAIVLLAMSFWLTPILNLNLTLWFTLLPLTLIGLLIQTAAEELVFRGYLQQQLAARFRSPLIWMLIPSLAFAALHYDPSTAGDNTWLIVAATGTFGLLAADLTRLTGSLGAAWGFHFANNLWAITLLAVNGNLTGLALYVTPYSADDTTILPTLILGDLAIMALAWLILRRLLTR